MGVNIFFYELMGLFLLGSLTVREKDKSGNPGLRCRQPSPWDQVEEGRPGQTGACGWADGASGPSRNVVTGTDPRS